MDSSSLFKFTKGEIKVENILRMVQWKLMMAYLKIFIGKSRSKGGRKGS